MYFQQQQQQQQAGQRGAMNQPGSEGSMNVSGLAGNNQNQQFLPASAPVSSLLPPIPNHNAHSASSMQSQLAALLSNSGHSGYNGQFGVQQNHYGNMVESADSQSAFSSNGGGGGGSAGMSNTMVPGMQNWNVDRLGKQALFEIAANRNERCQKSAFSSLSCSIITLEKHVHLLNQMKQPVPQTVALLLADARRKTEKKEAKRVANRKSACTSRARKKALVQEMSETNARLK
jgi:hypothetical protein